MPEETPSRHDHVRRDRRVVALLWLLPLWLVVSSGIGLWLWWRGQASGAAEEPAKFTTPVEAGRLADDLHKLAEVVGERHLQSAEGAYGLKRAAAMIDGSLGPSNAGYRVKLLAPGAGGDAKSTPLIVATLPGDERPALWVVAGYDTVPGSGGVEANSTGVSSLIAVAQALAGESPGRPVTFAFVPHVYDAEGPVLPALDRLATQASGADLVLVVEAMGAGVELMVSSRDAVALGRPALQAGTTIVGAEAICLEDDFDASAVLFEMGLPAVRVSTRSVVAASEDDRTLPDPALHAAATARLAALVRRLASAS